MKPEKYIAKMEAKNPPVTDANILNELEYWLERVPPAKLLDHLAFKFNARRARHREPIARRRAAWESMAKALEALAEIAGAVWNEDAT